MMLLNLHKKKWTEGLTVTSFEEQEKSNVQTLKELRDLAKGYKKAIQDEENFSKEKLVVQKVGKLDPKKHIEQNVVDLMSYNITQCLGTMLDAVIF